MAEDNDNKRRTRPKPQDGFTQLLEDTKRTLQENRTNQRVASPQRGFDFGGRQSGGGQANVPASMGESAAPTPFRGNMASVNIPRTIANVPTEIDQETGLYKAPKIEDYNTGRAGGLMTGFQYGSKLGEGQDPMFKMGAVLGAGLTGLFNPKAAAAVNMRIDQDVVDQENKNILMRTETANRLAGLREAEAQRRKQEADKADFDSKLARALDPGTTAQDSMALINQISANPLADPAIKSQLDKKMVENIYRMANPGKKEGVAVTEAMRASLGPKAAQVTAVEQAGTSGLYTARGQDGTALFTFNPNTMEKITAQGFGGDFDTYAANVTKLSGKKLSQLYTGYDDVKAREAFVDTAQLLAGANATPEEYNNAFFDLLDANMRERFTSETKFKTVTVNGRVTSLDDLRKQKEDKERARAKEEEGIVKDKEAKARELAIAQRKQPKKVLVQKGTKGDGSDDEYAEIEYGTVKEVNSSNVALVPMSIVSRTSQGTTEEFSLTPDRMIGYVSPSVVGKDIHNRLINGARQLNANGEAAGLVALDPFTNKLYTEKSVKAGIVGRIRNIEGGTEQVTVYDGELASFGPDKKQMEGPDFRDSFVVVRTVTDKKTKEVKKEVFLVKKTEVPGATQSYGIKWNPPGGQYNPDNPFEANNTPVNNQ